MRRLAGNDPEVNEEWISDKDRFAFHYARQDDRLTYPMVRDRVEDGGDGELRPASWPEAFAVAARGLQAAGASAVLTGGRVTAEDAYAYAKFARVALGTNDIDFRARPHTAEEADFLASFVALSDERAPTPTSSPPPSSCSPASSPRTRRPRSSCGCARRPKGKTKVVALAPYPTRGLAKMKGRLIPTVPGTEAEALRALADDGLTALDAGGVILVGERLAQSHGALTAALELAKTTGARLAWVPRRAGDRGAVEAGCLPTLLPGGRPAARRLRPRRCRHCVGRRLAAREAVGRDGNAIVAALAKGDLGGLVIGGVDPDDTSDPAATLRRDRGRRFVVSLEQRLTDVTARADVVLPVAPVTDKAGTFVTWEGRPRPFEAVFSTPASLPDLRILAGIADELGAPLGFRTPRRGARRDGGVGPWDGARPALDARQGAQEAQGQGRRARALHLEAAARPRLDAGRRRPPRGHRPPGRRPAQPGGVRRSLRHARGSGDRRPHR